MVLISKLFLHLIFFIFNYYLLLDVPRCGQQDQESIGMSLGDSKVRFLKKHKNVFHVTLYIDILLHIELK